MLLALRGHDTNSRDILDAHNSSMARLARIVLPDIPHHVTQRGNRRMAIFSESSDFALYRDLLAERLKLHGVVCSAYCLMPDHVYLLLTPTRPDAASGFGTRTPPVFRGCRFFSAPSPWHPETARIKMTMFKTEPPEHIIMSSDSQGKPRTRYVMIFNYNRQGKPGFLLENRLSLAPDEKALRPPPGRRGFRDYAEMPRFLFDKSVGLLPQDLELIHDYWLVSDRTKSVFEAVDPAGFAFLACDIRLPSGDYDGPPYWLCDVVRVLDALDEVQSRLTIGIRESKIYSDFGKKYYSIEGGYELVFRDDAIGDAHVFRMEYLQPTVICDQTMKDACKAAGLKGIKFDSTSRPFG